MSPGFRRDDEVRVEWGDETIWGLYSKLIRHPGEGRDPSIHRRDGWKMGPGFRRDDEIGFGAMKQFAVYIVANGRNGTLYIGVTSNLPQRIWQHKNKVLPGFTARHGCERLVWFQLFDNAEGAILREKQMKEWKRAWKIALIEKDNPSWNDLFESL